MSIEVQTSDSTCWVKRGSNLYDYDTAYTVLFNIYLPADNPTSDTAWFISGNTGSSSGTNIGNVSDQLRWKSDNDFNAECFDGTIFLAPLISTAFTSGWNRVAIVKESQTAVHIRANGASSSTSSNAGFANREATAWEALFSRLSSGQACPVGTRITNYKVWTAALSDAEIDAEHVTTSIVKSSGFYSQSPMGDENTLSNNLTQIGSSSSWTAGAGMVAGLNDPGVDYGAGGGSGVPKSNKFFLMGIG